MEEGGSRGEEGVVKRTRCVMNKCQVQMVRVTIMGCRHVPIFKKKKKIGQQSERN